METNEKPVKLNLKKYMRDTADINGYYVDVNKLAAAAVVTLPVKPTDDIPILIENTWLYLVNEPATIAMLNNYMILKDE